MIKSCRHIQEAIYFGPDEIRTCCQRFFYKGKMKGDACLITTMEPTKVSYQEILEAKRALLEKINNDEESPCKGCPQIELKDWPAIEASELKTISVENHSLCNMKCTYCSPLYFGGVSPKYDVLTATKDAPISKTEKVLLWGGGEPTARPDFEALFEELSGIFQPQTQRIFTNAIIYSESIQRSIDNHKTFITTSIDAGTEGTFEKVRKNKGFRKVLANLKKYASRNPEMVTVKYILTEANSEIHELDQFISSIKDSELELCHFLISTDFKAQKLSDEILYSGLYLYCKLYLSGIRAINLDDHFFNRVKKRSSLFELLGQLSVDLGHCTSWLEELDQKFSTGSVRKVVLWGSGQQSELLYKRITGHAKKRYEVLGVTDSSQNRWGCKVGSHIVENPTKFDFDNCGIIIASSNYYGEIYGQIIRCGISRDAILPNIFL